VKWATKSTECRPRKTAKKKIPLRCNRPPLPNELAGSEAPEDPAATSQAGIALTVRTSGRHAVDSTKGIS
jgi:hypothetical protein